MKYDDFIHKLQSNVVYRCSINELCKQSFFYYLKIVFYIINGSNMTFKPFHHKIIKHLQDIVDCKNKKRNLALCLPVGSGKSLIVEYFITWCFARTINNTFCYVSHSDRLINKLSKECKDIITNPIWVLIFQHILKKDDRQRVNFSFENAKNRTGLTAGAMGSAITGLDAGNPNINGFSGALIIDDAMDAGNARYETARKEVITYYDEKLATRRRTPNTPTILIMQRLHREDLVGWIEANESDLWEICKVKAIDNNKSFWEERYPLEELKHIKSVNNFKFMSQYQQDPIVLGGEVIKRSWFNYYNVSTSYHYKKIVIAGDTAMSVKQNADRSCFIVGGVTDNNQLHILDCIVGRWDYPTLKQNIIALWNKWQFKNLNITSASSLNIEEKASGIQLLQELKKYSIPLIPLKAEKDKLSRIESVLEYIASGQVYLPDNEQYGFNSEILNEVESFTRDDSHAHDDITDTLVYLIMSTIARREISILEVL